MDESIVLNKVERQEEDSLAWGTPSKGGTKKVYGDVNNAPKDFGKKIVRMRIAERLAMGEVSYDQYLELIDKVK